MFRLAALAREHLRLRRRHKRLADSFKRTQPPLPDTPADVVPGGLQIRSPAETVEFLLTFASQYRWRTDLRAFFTTVPAEAVLTASFRVVTPIQDLPASFSASTSGQELVVSAGAAFSGRAMVEVEATVDFLGETATDTMTIQFMYENPQVSIRLTRDPNAYYTLVSPAWQRSLSLPAFVEFTPPAATLSYQIIQAPPTNLPQLQANISGDAIIIRNLTVGYQGNQPIRVRFTATLGGQSDFVDMTFWISSTRPLADTTPDPDPPPPDPDPPTPDPTDPPTPEGPTPFVRVTALGDITAPLALVRLNPFLQSYTAPLPVADYFTVTHNLQSGEPTVTYSLDVEEAPVQASIFGGSLILSANRPFDGPRRVVLRAVAVAGNLFDSATKTWNLLSHTPEPIPTLTIDNPALSLALSPDNNWQATYRMASAFGISVAPPTSQVIYNIVSQHSSALTSRPRAWITNNPPSPIPAGLTIRSDSEGSFAGTQQVIVSVTARNEGALTYAQNLVHVNVSYDALTMRAVPGGIARRDMRADIPHDVNLLQYVVVNTGTPDQPTFTASTSWLVGGDGITVNSSAGNRLVLTPDINTVLGDARSHILRVELTASYRGDSEMVTLDIPLLVVEPPIALDLLDDRTVADVPLLILTQTAGSINFSPTYTTAWRATLPPPLAQLATAFADAGVVLPGILTDELHRRTRIIVLPGSGAISLNTGVRTGATGDGTFFEVASGIADLVTWSARIRSDLSDLGDGGEVQVSSTAGVSTVSFPLPFGPSDASLHPQLRNFMAELRRYTYLQISSDQLSIASVIMEHTATLGRAQRTEFSQLIIVLVKPPNPN